MEVLLIIVFIAVGAVFLFQRALQARGKRFVRAFYFLKKLESGLSVEASNRAAQALLNTGDDLVNHHDIIMEANYYIMTHYNGRQLPLINHAVRKGFRDQPITSPKVSHHLKGRDNRSENAQTSEQRIYDMACKCHESFLASEIDTIDDVRFSAAALGALDGTMQALGHQVSEIERHVMGLVFITQQLTEFSRVDKLETDRIADVAFNAMNSDVHHEIIGAASLAAFTMYKQQGQ